MKNIYQALLKAQVKIDCAIKDSSNPHYKSKYASLESVIESIKKPLNDNGVLILHLTEEKEGFLFLKTSLVHAESGESVSSSSKILNNKGDMQGYGSAISYLKRYNLTALTNLPTEDDDGNKASENPPQQKQVPKSEYKKTENTNPNDYIIQLGKNKMTGTRLQDHTFDYLSKCVNDTIKWHKDNNKTMHSNTQEFVNRATEYLKSQPNFNSDESIPF